MYTKNIYKNFFFKNGFHRILSLNLFYKIYNNNIYYLLTKVTPVGGPVTSAIPMPILYNDRAAVTHNANKYMNRSSKI